MDMGGYASGDNSNLMGGAFSGGVASSGLPSALPPPVLGTVSFGSTTNLAGIGAAPQPSPFVGFGSAPGIASNPSSTNLALGNAAPFAFGASSSVGSGSIAPAGGDVGFSMGTSSSTKPRRKLRPKGAARN